MRAGQRKITPGRRRQAKRRAERRALWSGPKIACHCCGCLTICQRGQYEICKVCYWEDDPGQTPEEDTGGANPLSLEDAQKNYRITGACEPNMLPHVRPPAPDEQPPET